MSRVDQCYANKEEAHQVNAVATSQLADLAERHEARLVMVSTDLVFDGSAPPYAEEAAACPRSHYGRTKLLGEQAVLSHRQGLVARVSLLFGPARNGRLTFFDQQREALQRREPCRLFADEWRTPLSLSMAARVLRQLALSDKTGLVHVGGPERMSRLEMGERLAKFLGLSTEAIVPVHQKELVTPEPRPSDVSLDSRRLQSWLPELSWLTFDESLAELCEVRGDSDYPATDRGPTRWK
jgi:dTDP-4-dehydrorhamnose reductase